MKYLRGGLDWWFIPLGGEKTQIQTTKNVTNIAEFPLKSIGLVTSLVAVATFGGSLPDSGLQGAAAKAPGFLRTQSLRSP